MQSQDRKHAKFSGVFIYQDLKTIEDTNNAITIIILITAIVFLIVSTIFAFFLSSRSLHRQSMYRMELLSKTTVNTKDEIGELSYTFNNMSYKIQEHIEALSTQKIFVIVYLIL